MGHCVEQVVEALGETVSPDEEVVRVAREVHQQTESAEPRRQIELQRDEGPKHAKVLQSASVVLAKLAS